jgi:hypothetical protein
MAFSLVFTEEARANLRELQSEPGLAKRYKAVLKTIGYLEANPRHPSLQTHEYKSLTPKGGEKVFEVYAEQSTPAAYRVFWRYGPGKGYITIIAITSHP